MEIFYIVLGIVLIVIVFLLLGLYLYGDEDLILKVIKAWLIFGLVIFILGGLFLIVSGICGLL